MESLSPFGGHGWMDETVSIEVWREVVDRTVYSQTLQDLNHRRFIFPHLRFPPGSSIVVL